MRFVNAYKKKIDSRLQAFLDERILRAKGISPKAKETIEHIKEFNLRGGKRIRPILVVLGYKACGGRNEDAIIDAALAVELMESFLLMHDDIMDRDELRRGYLTMHKIYENKARRHYRDADAEHYGNSMAMILGDIAAILASEALLEADFPAARKLQAVEKFNRVVVNTCFGQILDLHSEIESVVTEQEVLRLHKLKTAIYTVEGPLIIGALLAGASERQKLSLSDYAIPLGMAFQIKDDILGLFGSKEETGKAVGNDVREGKKTLLVLRALDKASKKDRQYLKSCLGNRRISEKDIRRIQKIVISTGSLDYSNALAARLIDKSKCALHQSSLRQEVIQMLLDLADYVQTRIK